MNDRITIADLRAYLLIYGHQDFHHLKKVRVNDVLAAGEEVVQLGEEIKRQRAEVYSSNPRVFGQGERPQTLTDVGMDRE